MTLSSPVRRASLALALLSVSGLALAHTGADAGAHHDGLLAGLLHPFSGLDHLAAMLAVGLWSAVALRRVWAAPLAFAGMLAVGALAGFAGVVPPAVEPMIAASLLVLGLLVATRRELPPAAAAALVSVFALFHGAAHGTELAGAQASLSLIGMLLSTAALHLTGVLIGQRWLAQRRWAQGAAGTAVALLGGLLLAGAI